MCKHCDPARDCAHDRETDEWIVPADLRRPTPASMSGPLAPERPETAHGPALTRDGFTEALLRRDGGR